MKKFLNNILIFAILSYISVLARDYTYSEKTMQSNSVCIESWYDLMHGNIDADVVVMGSSRAWVHVDPHILDSILCVNSYNLGIDGSCIDRQVKKYRLFRRYNKRPKIIIQNIDFSSLGHTNGYQLQQFFPYFWNLNVRKEFFSTEPFTLAQKYIPMYRFSCTDIPLNSSPRSLYKGYKGQERTWNGEKLRQIDSISFKYDERTVRLFNDYLTKAKAEGTKIIFVYSPLYIGATNKLINQEEMYSYYRSIAKKYDIPILDYTYMNICYDTTYFYNAMHLTKTGAEIFSDSLAKDIKRLGILKKTSKK